MCVFATPLVCLPQLSLIFTYSEINIEFNYLDVTSFALIDSCIEQLQG